MDTIIPRKRTKCTIGMANDLSEIDLKKINTLYNCQGFPHVNDPLVSIGRKGKKQKKKPKKPKKRKKGKTTTPATTRTPPGPPMSKLLFTGFQLC